MRAVRDYLYTKGHKTLFQLRRLSPGARAMPHFIVIGAQKSGTSSMFSYLKQHPQIVRPIFKEPYFFDRHYHRGLSWYGCNFPARGAIDRLDDRLGRPHLTFEATATYVFDTEVPARIARDIKTRKFILLLRNPAERAISAYWHARRMGIESRSLAEAMDADLSRYQEEIAFEKGTGPAPQGDQPRPTYLRRGIYHEAVSRWQSVFSPKDLLILQSETMFADPAAVMAQVFAFLEIAHPEHIDFAPQNVGKYDARDAKVREILQEFYRPHNEHLNSISQTRIRW
ncbi:MAG TPA: sulfotransferase domain-containing protein [Rhizomicrobium sp.]|nr:sulfotransferase domain-containing protein [Rhizomicrobium sp.]